MGHIRLGVLPKSRKWRQIVNELQLRAGVEEIAARVAEAAEATLKARADDPAFLHAFWLLTQTPLAARGPDFAADLGRLGIKVPGPPSLTSLIAALSEAIDRHVQESGRRTDLGEMAQMSAVESLTAVVAPALPSLFGPSPEETQRAIGRLASGDRFSGLAREFSARARFDDALDRHCRETSRIIDEFAGGWYGKNVYQGEGLTPVAVSKFAPVAFKKIRAELRKRRDAEK